MEQRRLFNEINALKRRVRNLNGETFSSSLTITGDVGIGTTNPDYELDVAGDIGVDEYIYHNGDGDTYIRFQNNNVNIVAGGTSAIKLDKSTGKIRINNTNANLDVQIMADDGDVIFHTDAGTNRVGIGTDSPVNKLQIDHTGADGDDGLIIVRTDSTTADTNLLGGIGFDSTDGNVPSTITEASCFIAAYAAEAHGTGDKGGDLAFGCTLINDDDDTTSHEYMRILDSGFIGIGTSAPEAYLDIRNTVDDGTTNRTMLRLHNYRSDDADVNDFGPISIDFVIENLGGGTKEGIARIAAVSSPTGTDHDSILEEKTSGLIFSTMNNNTLAEAMRINASGSVGIGTTSPDYELDVAGDIGVDEFIYHNGDADTFIKFIDDTIILKAGGSSMMRADPDLGQVIINNGTIDLDFLVRADDGSSLLFTDAANNRVGIGTDTPGYTLDVAGNIGLNEYIYHNGDADTFIRFTGDDINFRAGGVNMMDFTEGTAGAGGANHEITFNENNADLDFRVESENHPHMLFVDASTDRVGINTSSPATKLHVKSPTGTGTSVIKLEQLDTDEPFIRFEGTTASDQTKSLSTDTSVGSLTGHIRVSINGTDFWVPYYATN